MPSIIQVGKTPYGRALNPKTSLLYVANTDDDTVSVIDGQKNVLLQSLTVGGAPIDVTVNPNTNTIYVANSVSNNIRYRWSN